jgi:hypothetical protein
MHGNALNGPSLFQNKPIPIHQRLDVLERGLAFDGVTDGGTVVIVLGAIVQVPAQAIVEDAQAGRAVLFFSKG